MPSAARVTLIAALVIGAFTALVWFLPTRGDEEVRLLEDDHDRQVYYMRGSWLPRHAVPYLEVHSEYPELATWSFALPYLLIDAPSDGANYESAKAEDVERYRPIFERYANLHSLEMAACLLLLILISAKLLEHLGRDPRFAWLLLLPSSLFFSLSRYDVLPALLVSSALLALLKGRHRLAIVLLSCGVLVKWYAILFLPYFLNYAKRVLGERVLPGLLLSASVAAVVVGTTFVSGGRRYVEIANDPGGKRAIEELAKPSSQGGAELPRLPAALGTLVAKLPESWQTFATGGLRAALHPYLVQGQRVTNPGGLYQQMKERWFDIAARSETEGRILLLLTALQFGMLLFGCFVPMRDPMQLARWMCLATACFVLFAKFYSPQWVIWTNALVLLFMRHRLLIAVAAGLDLFIYAQFAIIRGTSLRGTRNPDGTFALSDFWYHLYDVRIAITAMFTLLVLGSLIAHRRRAGAPPIGVPA